ncbi:hypothetical protein DL93DRAFT_1094582 [Clavulina sp. PMI_390]|nr:hypothetical protein DL93DRAFT_1094582 [Clavulina sp. PMI_390]
MAVFGVQAVYKSFRFMPRPKKDAIPRIIFANNLLSLSAECVVCALLCAAVFRAKIHDSPNPLVARMAHYAIPSYVITMIWQFAFSVSFWLRLPFAVACVGIPLGAVSNITLLAMLHANPSALGPPMWRQLDPMNPILFPTKIVVDQDISTQSCHDGPSELRLMERLDKMFPYEEESRTYQQEPVDPDPGDFNFSQ